MGRKGTIFVVQELFDQNVFSYIMLALCAFGILLKLVLNLVYWRLIKASDNMATSKNKLTQTMKKKFETCYKLKIGVNNVDIFVDKYVFRHRFCGILLSTWENIGGQVLILCLLVGSISTILGLIYECGKQQILGTFSVGILTSGLLIFLEGLINLSGKRELIRLNMKDYLENILKVRLEQELVQPEFLEQYKKEYLSEDGGVLSGSVLAATVEKTNKQLRKERKDKLANIKTEKIREKKEKKEALRTEKINKKEAAKAAIKKKKEDKKLNKLNSQKQKELKKQQAKEEEERIKKETKLALERKRELERAEIERIKAEVREEEDKKKEEKRRQEEIKKALLLEKQAAKEEKRKPQTEYKTIAQERKENLLKEIKERRTMEAQEHEKEIEIQVNHGDKIAATVMDETAAALKPFAEKAHVEKVQMEKAHVEKAQIAQVERASVEKKQVERMTVEKPQVEKPVAEKVQIEKPHIQKPAAEKAQDEKLHVKKNIEDIHTQNLNEKSYKEELKAETQKAVVMESGKEKTTEIPSEKKSAAPEQKTKTAGRKSRQSASSDEKLIEDILKEFLA